MFKTNMLTLITCKPESSQVSLNQGLNPDYYLLTLSLKPLNKLLLILNGSQLCRMSMMLLLRINIGLLYLFLLIDNPLGETEFLESRKTLMVQSIGTRLNLLLKGFIKDMVLILPKPSFEWLKLSILGLFLSFTSLINGLFKTQW